MIVVVVKNNYSEKMCVGRVVILKRGRTVRGAYQRPRRSA